MKISAVSSYPSNTQAVNISKETTLRELIDIAGIDKDVFKLQNINLISGPVNSLEYTNKMLNFKTPQELEKMFLEHKKEKKKSIIV